MDEATNGTAIPTFQRHPDTTILIKQMEKCEVGKLLTYEHLCNLVGRTREELRSIANTAMRALEQEGIFFLCVRAQGYKRVTHQEAIAKSEAARKFITKKVRRTRRSLSHIDPNECDQGGRMRLFSEAAFLSMHAHIEKAKNQKNVLTAVEKGQKALTMSEAAKLLMGNK